MKVEEIAEAVAKLPPDQLARFRRWFTAFEAGRPNHAEELDSAAAKLGSPRRPRVCCLEKTRAGTVSKCQSRTHARTCGRRSIALWWAGLALRPRLPLRPPRRRGCRQRRVGSR